MKEILAKLVEGKDLTKEEAMKAQELILTGQATDARSSTTGWPASATSSSSAA